jgi:itaconate CoA-transferase
MFRDEYRRKLATPEKAVEVIQNGTTLILGLGMAEPPALLAAIAKRLRSGDLKSLKVYSLLPQKCACETVLALDLCDQVEAYSWFVSGMERGLVRAGLNYFVPSHFHQISRLIRDFMEVEVTVTTVSTMDQAGYFSFGTANDFTSTAARKAKRLIVEVNENMPRVFGDSLLHISEVDAIIENHVSLLEFPSAEPKPEDEIIGKTIAEMMPDGATIQLGLGGLPNAVAAYLKDHKDLGIHTEIFGTGMVELIKKGIVTGAEKTLHLRKHIFTTALGDKAMLDFMNDNPAMESYPVSYTNHPSIIAKNDDMISVNAILQADLLGQCNAEFLAGYQFSGTGGQLDFVRGAFDSKGGKSILAFHATAKKGEISRIVPRFDEGTMITTPRMDTHFLVTEFGVANLKGKSTRERALAIINLAHPKFRGELLQEAEKMYLL